VRYRWVVLSPAALSALVEGRLDDARALTRAPLTPWLLGEAWLWRIRLDQLAHQPDGAGWVARAAWCQDGPDAGSVVGHVGFHGPPDCDGRVEVAYSVDPRCRRRGHARAMLAQVLAEIDAMPQVRVVRASISPRNLASLATIRGLGFDEVGHQWDDEDGLEVLWERRRPANAARAPGAAPWGAAAHQDLP
jgi:RimJ/RimL family protein N-acetyltransferase